MNTINKKTKKKHTKKIESKLAHTNLIQPEFICLPVCVYNALSIQIE